ncbi:MAG: cell division protein SepF [Nanoarchaeota archaeon]
MVFWKKKEEEEFVDIKEANKEKIKVQFLKLMNEPDIENVRAAIAEGKTIVMLNIGYMKDKEKLKRAIASIKKDCSTFEGDIVALNQSLILITPNSVNISRGDNQIQNGGKQNEEREPMGF